MANQAKADMKWITKEEYPDGIQIHTEDGSLRIFGMFHSGFGVSDTDREIAAHVVALHNASLPRGKA